MNSLEQKRKLKTSIRPNGKIRPIPKNSQATISLNDIQPGNVMANFHNEYLYDRFYKAQDVESLLKTTAKNPFTRQNLRLENVETYYASVNGDAGGRTIPNSAVAATTSEYTQVRVTFEPSWGNHYIRLQPYIEGGEPLNPAKEILVEKTTPLAIILGKFMETSFDSSWFTPLYKYINLFGIRDTENSFILNPGYIIKYNLQTLITNYLVPISTYISSTGTNKLYVLTSPSLIDRLQVPLPNLPVTPEYRGVASASWIGIKSDIIGKIEEKFKNWLLENSTDYEEYKNGVFTENTIQKGAELRDLALKLAEGLFLQRIMGLRRRRWGGTRKSIRRSRKKTMRK